MSRVCTSRSRGAALVLVLAVGCAGVRAHSDFDPNARFDTYRSYAWISKEPVLANVAEEGVRPIDPLLERRIRESIEDRLEAKGYRRVEDAQAGDFAIAFSVGSREKIQITSTPAMGPGWYGRYGGWYAASEVSARSYTEGTLAIDVFDVDSHQAVWHGWATKRVSDRMDREKLVDEVVGAILARFPPER